MTPAVAYGTLARVGLGAGALGMGALGVGGLAVAYIGTSALYKQGVMRHAEKMDPSDRQPLSKYFVRYRSLSLATFLLLALSGAAAGTASLYLATLVGKVVWIGAGSLALKTPLAITISGAIVAAATLFFHLTNVAKFEATQP